jgi:hypothetical protein
MGIKRRPDIRGALYSKGQHTEGIGTGQKEVVKNGIRPAVKHRDMGHPGPANRTHGIRKIYGTFPEIDHRHPG